MDAVSLFKPLTMFVAAVGMIAAPSASGFSDGFDSDVVLYETADMSDSNDNDWWLNSGAYFYRSGGIGMTVQGKLADDDQWRLLYATTNPVDTDDGYRPQNIFRLVTRSKFKNFTQQVYFNIERINASGSPNRNESNGVLFFHRYQNGDNLYYAGIRVDGYAVIKKKLNGKYYTLKTVGIYQGGYDRVSKPNLIPTNQWIGLRTVISDNAAGNVIIALYLNDPLLGADWTKVLEVEDTGSPVAPLLNEGYAGIRTDFMDIRFDHYEAIEKQDIADAVHRNESTTLFHAIGEAPLHPPNGIPFVVASFDQIGL
ncbi:MULTISPECIES: hypothetical protein [Methylocaldum]|jgi:hypothetical protein|uniref:hypothetical protein n=1 Tax=Methylocaldum sp. 0917 TaxID=2485163 RepID=UPI00105F1C38